MSLSLILIVLNLDGKCVIQILTVRVKVIAEKFIAFLTVSTPALEQAHAQQA